MSDKTLLIVGPTGTGKSLLALEVALKLNTGIINADSVQVYKDLVIGSAQPSKEDFKIVPHYLYGYLPIGSSLTVAEYCKSVEFILQSKFSHKVPLFCGGSGFYIQALEKGMFDVPTLSDAEKKRVDEYIQSLGWAETYKKLLMDDPGVGGKIHENDHYRIRRAVEILLIAGKKPSQMGADAQSSPLKNKHIIKVGLDLDKELLRERILKRTQKMMAEGWVEEVERILEMGHRSWAALRSVGYSEVVDYLDGHLDKSQMIEKIVISNMQLIKKQRTWFKRDKDIVWFSSEKTTEAVHHILNLF